MKLNKKQQTLLLIGLASIVGFFSCDYNKNHWTQEDRENLIQECMQYATIADTIVLKKYCDCSTDKTMKALTKSQYDEMLTKTQGEQIQEIMPIIQDCVEELQKYTDGINKQASQ